MNSIYGMALERLNEFSQFMQDSLTNFLECCQQSRLWVLYTDEVAMLETGSHSIAAVAMRETEAEVLIEARIPHADSQMLTLQFTQETILFRGKWTEKAGVEGYFRPGEVKNLIPLPYPVVPESARVQLKNDVLMITLLKQTAMAPYRVSIHLPPSRISDPDSKGKLKEVEPLILKK